MNNIKTSSSKITYIGSEIEKDINEIMFTDRKRLKQILLNLLTNAIKFTGQGGLIIIRINCYNEGLLFEIEDNGIGISEERLLKLQQLLKSPKFLFSQNINSINSTSCCLGLLISQNLVLQLGTEESTGITVKSEMNCGSIFKFSVYSQPSLKQSQNISFNSDENLQNQNSLCSENESNQKLLNEEQVQLIPTFHTLNLQQEFDVNKREQNNLNLPGFHPTNQEEYILIVDDDCFNLLALELNLNKLNKKCLKAYNGQEAISQLLSIYKNPNSLQFISLILMDFQMPVIDGIEATRQIQQLIKQEIIPKIPVVACTAYGAKEQIAQCLDAGMIDYLIKPVSNGQLFEFLKKWNFVQ